MSNRSAISRGHLKLEDGGKPRPRRMRLRTKEELDLDDRMQRRYLALVGRDGTVPSRAIQEIREGRQAPWRLIGRRGVEMHRAGCTADEIKLVLAETVAEWVDAHFATPVRRAA